MSSQTWTTTHEKRFVDYLIDPPKDVSLDKSVTDRLRGYIEWGRRRIAWETWDDSVDGREAVKYAESRLRELL